MTLPTVELGGRSVSELEHGGFGVAVLALEARDRVQPLVDRFQAPRLGIDSLAELAHGQQRLFDLSGRGVERRGGVGEGAVEPAQVTQDAGGPSHPAGGRVAILEE